MPRDPTYPLVPIANIFAAYLLILTFISNRIRGVHNRGVIMLIGWVLVQVIIMAVHSIVWSGTWQVMVPVFCDISSHLWQGLSVGIPACSLVITRRLWLAVQSHSTTNTGNSYKEMLIDYFFGLGVPLLNNALYYTVQGARFQVLENYGCTPYVFGCGAAILISQMWGVILPLLSISLYGWRIVLYLSRHERATNRLLGDSGLDRRRYIRTLIVASFDIAFMLPLQSITIAKIAANIESKTPFWPGWGVVKQWWAPQTVADVEWRDSPAWVVSIYWDQFSGVVFSVIIFLLFGLTKDALELYKKAFARGKGITSPVTTPRNVSPSGPHSVAPFAVQSVMS